MTQQSNQPNLYQLSGDGIQITYTLANTNGQPQLDYQDSTGNSTTFSGNQIRSEQSMLGTLITVFLVQTIDSGSTTLTLLVPGVNLAPTTQQNIETIAIVTNNLFSILEIHKARQTQTYQIYNLQGTAQSQAATTGGLVISADADSYNIGDTIVITFSNQGSQAITVSDHLTNCSVIQLQRQEDGNWKDVYPCLLEIVTLEHNMEPGQSLTVEFDSSSYDPGLYRATESSRTVFSDEFQIG